MKVPKWLRPTRRKNVSYEDVFAGQMKDPEFVLEYEALEKEHQEKVRQIEAAIAKNAEVAATDEPA